MKLAQATQAVEEVFGLYENYGHADYIGEPVSQLEHMCQAGMLAWQQGFDDETVLAAFFHDIGHLCEFIMPVAHMDGFGIVDHESIGANYLRQKGFSEKVASLVQSHVQAKRYLTAKHVHYYEKLSPASRNTLEMQGGKMSEAELHAFENDPLHDSYIQLRHWDDEAKAEDMPLPDLQMFKSMALRHLLANEAQ